MRVALALIAVLASACGFSVSGAGGDAQGSGSDAGHGSDGGVDDADADTTTPDASLFPTMCEWSYNPVYADPCPGMPGADVEIAGGQWSYDTTAGTLLAPTSATPQTFASDLVDDQRRVWVHHMHIASDGTLRLTGTYPVAFISTTDITIDGTIIASGFADPNGGPIAGPGGANAALCHPGDTNGAFDGAPCGSEGAAGGGGGGFGGGNGGNGGGGGTGKNCGAGLTGPIPGANGGVSLGTLPSTLRGGCNGGHGGKSSQGGGAFGQGGGAGGAVALIARNDVSIIGKVVAGGGGGGGGNMSRSGGGGGGSGGMIALEGNTVHINTGSAVAANGGGGGGGCDGNAAQPGQDGPANSMSALGGAKEAGGTAGAIGGGLGNVAGTASIADRGGGGGGGAIGWIYLHAPNGVTKNGIVAPTPQTAN